MEDALKRLDKLTHEEAWMGIAQNLKATHAVGERVGVVDDRVAEVIRGALIMFKLIPEVTLKSRTTQMERK